MLKKIVSCIILLSLALCIVSCGENDPDAPDGMVSATVSGEPFKLYVPESWSENTVSGISRAYYQANQNISVSARYVSAGEGETLDAYMDECKASMEQRYPTEFLLKEDKVAAKLGDNGDARKNTYKIKRDGKFYISFQLTVLKDGLFISLYGNCIEDKYEERKADYDSIRKNFKFVPLPQKDAAAVTDKNTPKGMKIASHKDAEYVLYVPKEWKCNPSNKGAYAFYPVEGNPNVTVSSHAPEESIATPDLYFAKVEEGLILEFGEENYERITESGEKIKVGGMQAYKYLYTVKVGDTTVKLQQVIISHNTYVYSITYSADADHFDANLGDVNLMLKHFKFK